MLERFIDVGPPNPTFVLLEQELQGLAATRDSASDIVPAKTQTAFARVREHFLTQDGQPRKQLDRAFAKPTFPSERAWRAHRDLVVANGPLVLEAWNAFRRDLNILVARGTWRMYRVAETEYRRTLDAHSVLDFSDVLQ